MTTTPTTPSERAVHAHHGYGSDQIAYHWTIVALVVANWLLGRWGMRQVFFGREAGEVVTNLGPAYVHIAFGASILILMLMRLGARIKRPVRTAAGTKHPLLARLGQINHWAFYAVLIALPLVGALAWFGGGLAWAYVHRALAWLLVALIVLHVGGALVHLLLGENILRRMVRPTGGT